MKPIELRDGYMICLVCRGYIEASTQTPPCECPETDLAPAQGDQLN